MYKFGSIEEAAKAHAEGQFNKVEPQVVKKPPRRGAMSIGPVEEATIPQKSNLKRSVTTLDRKRRVPPPPPPVDLKSKSPTVVVEKPTKIAKTNIEEIAKEFNPIEDAIERVKQLDGELLKKALITTNFKTVLDVLDVYNKYVATISPQSPINPDKKPNPDYAIPSTLY